MNVLCCTLKFYNNLISWQDDANRKCYEVLFVDAGCENVRDLLNEELRLIVFLDQGVRYSIKAGSFPDQSQRDLRA